MTVNPEPEYMVGSEIVPQDEFSVLNFPVQNPSPAEIEQLVSEYNALQQRLQSMDDRLEHLVSTVDYLATKMDAAEKLLPTIAETMQQAMSQTPVGKILLKALGIH